MSDDNDWETAELDAPATKPAARKAASAWAPPAASHPAAAAAGPSQPRILSRNSNASGGGEDDEWFRGGQQGNRQIWDSANRATSSPMNVQVPGPPKLLVLKRPNAPKSDQPRSGSATPKSMTQREEEYRLARERIFGAASEENSNSAPGEAEGSSREGKADKAEARDSREGRDRRGEANSSRERGSRRSGTSTPNSRSGRSSPLRQGSGSGVDDLSREVDRLAIRGQGAAYQYPQYAQQYPQHPPPHAQQYAQYAQPVQQQYYQPQPRPPQPQRYQPQPYLYGHPGQGQEYPTPIGPPRAGYPSGLGPGPGAQSTPALGPIGPPPLGQLYGSPGPLPPSGPGSGRSSGGPVGPVPALRGGVSPGVVRQPRGPGQGGGFMGNGVYRGQEGR